MYFGDTAEMEAESGLVIDEVVSRVFLTMPYGPVYLADTTLLRICGLITCYFLPSSAARLFVA